VKARALKYLNGRVEACENAIHYYETLLEVSEIDVDIFGELKNYRKQIELMQDEIDHFEWIIEKINGTDEISA